MSLKYRTISMRVAKQLLRCLFSPREETRREIQLKVKMGRKREIEEKILPIPTTTTLPWKEDLWLKLCPVRKKKYKSDNRRLRLRKITSRTTNLKRLTAVIWLRLCRVGLNRKLPKSQHLTIRENLSKSWMRLKMIAWPKNWKIRLTTRIWMCRVVRQI